MLKAIIISYYLTLFREKIIKAQLSPICPNINIRDEYLHFFAYVRYDTFLIEIL